jgi:PfaB family protein
MEKIAIIGLSCLFPDAKNPDEFWQNLLKQKDSTSSATAQEMGIDPAIFYHPLKGTPDKTYSLKGGYIRNFEFDPTEYNLPPEFIESLDNTFKWSLYAAKEAIEHSGYWDNQDVLSKCGVILGNLSFPTRLSNQLISPIYQQTINSAIAELLQHDELKLAALPTQTKASLYNSMISGLPTAIVAQALSLSQTNFCLDAACSSSIYSVKLASYYLQTHKADMMLAGAISCSDSLFVRMLFSGVQGYAENGISRPLDKASRGLVPADGIGILALKRYSDAVRDGDTIHATIAGSGLSNDGRGKHLLSPNSKGQVLAFERAYNEAQISPKDIDYMECHATGTLLGDTTEFNSIETFFGQHQAAPLVGSAKANVGHLLTAAGMVGMIKVILGMSKGVIPATINVTEPIGTENNVISANQIVRNTTQWQNQSPIKRAAVSAFGFGGTNSHIILEQGSIANKTDNVTPLTPAKIAIVGMDAFFGGCNGLDAFERSIYEGTQHFIPLPLNRWHGIETQEDLLKEYGFADGKAPVGAYIQDFEIDTLASKIPPNELDKLNPQQLLILKVADRAVKDAGLKEGENVAVIIAAETELSVHQLQQRWNLSWQVQEGLISEQVCLPSEQLLQLESIIKDSIHNPVESSEYVSHIANIMASRVSSMWNFTGPAFTLSAGENSALKALEVAQMLLSSGEVDAVVVGAVDLAGGVENVLLRNKLASINTGAATLSFDQKANGWMVGEGAGAVVLKHHETAKKAGDRIYAVVDAVTFFQENSQQLQKPNQTAVNQTCEQAFNLAGIQPTEINYLEVFGSGIPEEDEAEIKGLLQSYRKNSHGLNCAIGSVKANIGHTYVASGIASLIKTALCLYYRYIPASPKWTDAKMPEMWQESPFYVACESRPWFPDKEATRRIAAINGMGIDGSYAHAIVSEETSQKERHSKYLQQTPFYLFPLAASGRTELLAHLSTLQKTIENSPCLANTATQTFTNYQKYSDTNYTLAILGRNKKELAKELDAAIKGVNNAFDKGSDWQTPLGSYFTAKPLGKVGEIAYVYPAAVNSYVGIGRNVFRLFPKVLDDLKNNNLYNRAADVEKLVYPRSLNKLSLRQLETLEKRLLEDSLAMFESEIAFARYMTTIFRDEFQIKPKSVFGYSLGETTMMVAQGVWSNFDSGSNTLNSSPLFGDRLSGPKNAVREYWGQKTVLQPEDNDFWSTYVLMATPSQVMECLKQENRVYLTQINTKEEVLIAGETAACQRIIETLGCNAFAAPFNHAIHCEPMRSEYGEIAKVNTLPSHNLANITFYSAAECAPITLDSNGIAHNIAQGLCQQLDFPKLVNRVWEDGARIFIEAGAGNVCSRWIDTILTGKDHITIALNRRGSDDHASIVKALAKLLSHRVSLDISQLYEGIESSSKNKATLKRVTLGGNSITAAILSEENRQLFQNLSGKLREYPCTNPAPTQPEFIQPEPLDVSEVENSHNIAPSITHEEEVPMINTINNSLAQPLSPPEFDYTITLGIIPTQYQQLTANSSNVNKAHATFLKTRQDFSKQMSEIIQLQIACVEQLLQK